MFFERGARQETMPAGAQPLLRIAVVGAGPSGLAVAIALMRRLPQSFEAWMIDAEDAPGAFAEGAGGAALMAEPAGDLSVLPDRPDDFALWLGDELAARAVAPLHGPQDLHAPRTLFRAYLMKRFSEALAMRPDVRIRTVRDAVRHIGAAAGGVRLGFQEGESALFDHVFVATGFGLAHREAASWQEARAAADRLAAMRNPPPLTLAGNGPRLAAVLLDLRARGFEGDIRVAAAPGGLPHPQGRGPGGAVFGPPPATRSLKDAFRYIRRECGDAFAREGGQWQAVVDAASARLGVVWRNLPPAARNRYRRHLLPLHRHFSIRIARDVHRGLAAEIATGRTVLVPLREGLAKADNTVDCREIPAARALAGMLGCDPAALFADECGHLFLGGTPLPGLSAIGAVASGLRPGPFTFAETVRQAYRGVLAMPLRRPTRAFGG